MEDVAEVIQQEKTLGVSEFLYIASLINVPEWVINTVESAIYGFVWKGKKDRIKRTVLINNNQ